VTPLVRREFKSDDHAITSSLAPWAAAVRKIAAEEYVPFIELHDRSKAVCEALGKDACVALLSNAKADGSGFDGTHLTSAVSMVMGAIVADELRRAVPEFAGQLRAIPKSSEAAPPTTAIGGGGGDRTTTQPATREGVAR
jgi:pectinesterase